VPYIGDDWLPLTADFRKSTTLKPRNTNYVDKPLKEPTPIEACNQLREEGWHFGCILLERHGTDYLRMQYSRASINVENIHIATTFGREIMSFVLEERNSRENTAMSTKSF